MNGERFTISRRGVMGVRYMRTHTRVSQQTRAHTRTCKGWDCLPKWIGVADCCCMVKGVHIRVEYEEPRRAAGA